jgi:hypothetical protein
MHKIFSGLLAFSIMLIILTPKPLFAESIIKDGILEKAIHAELKQAAEKSDTRPLSDKQLT